MSGVIPLLLKMMLDSIILVCAALSNLQNFPKFLIKFYFCYIDSHIGKNNKVTLLQATDCHSSLHRPGSSEYGSCAEEVGSPSRHALHITNTAVKLLRMRELLSELRFQLVQYNTIQLYLNTVKNLHFTNVKYTYDKHV